MRFKYLSAVFIFSFLCLASTPLAFASKNKQNEKIAQLEFRSISVGDALKVLTERSNLNIIASQKAARISITMYLKDISALEVIDAIAKTYNLWYKHDKNSNIIRIYTVEEYRLEQVEFKQEKTKIFTLKNAKNAIDLADTVCNLYGSERVILSFGSNENELLNDLSSRLSRFDLINSATGGGQASSTNNNNNGGGNNNNSNNNNNGSGSSNCVRNSRNNSSNNGSQNNNNRNNNNSNSSNNNSQTSNQNSLDSISSLLKDLNSKNSDLQAVLSGNAGQSNALLNRAIRHQAPIYVSVIKRQNRVLVRTRDIEAMEQISNLFTEIDKESSMLLMEVKILSIDLSDGYDSLFDFKIKSGKLSATEGQEATTLLQQSLVTAASAFNPALLATVVSDKFEARLQLLEQENRVTSIATPILLTTNQEVSRVFIGDERPIVTGYENSTNSTAANGSSNIINTSIIVPQTQTRNLGTTLFLTPNINSDRTVSIRILIERSGLSRTKATIPVQIGNALIDADIDVVQTETFSGTVVAKDGTSIAVGGFINESAGDKESKVPWLGDIPGLGFFFKEQANSRQRTELVVIIRPYITTTPNEASLVSHQYLEKNSIHPDISQMNNMGIYSNKDKRHKGYQLEKPFKEYDVQDHFDHFKDKGERALHTQSIARVATNKPSDKQKTYVELTQYAAKTIRIEKSQRKVTEGISPVKLNNTRSADLLYDSRIKVIPVASWRRGGVHVTALALYNQSTDTVNIDFKHLKGRWLSSSIESAKLDNLGDSTYLYLVSAGPFEDITARIFKP